MKYEPVEVETLVRTAPEGRVYTCKHCNAKIKTAHQWSLDAYCPHSPCSDRGKRLWTSVIQEVTDSSFRNDEEYQETRLEYKKKLEFEELLFEYEILIVDREQGSQMGEERYKEIREELWEKFNDNR